MVMRGRSAETSARGYGMTGGIRASSLLRNKRISAVLPV
jgi:hypothetical protein